MGKVGPSGEGRTLFLKFAALVNRRYGLENPAQKFCTGTSSGSKFSPCYSGRTSDFRQQGNPAPPTEEQNQQAPSTTSRERMRQE